MSTHTLIYIQEQGHTTNSLVVQHNHKNIQMHNHNLMLKKIIAAVGINVSPDITDVPDIPSIFNISNNRAFNKTYPPTYEPLHRPLITQNESSKNWFHTRNI